MLQTIEAHIPRSSLPEVTGVFHLQPVVTLVLCVSVDTEAVKGVEADLDFAVGWSLRRRKHVMNENKPQLNIAGHSWLSMCLR